MHVGLPEPPGDPSRLSVGDCYEDCSYQPRLCVLADHENDQLDGISLITGDVGSCSPTHCGVVPLSGAQAAAIALAWPPQEIIDYARKRDQLVPIPGACVTPDAAQEYRDRMKVDPVQQYRVSRLSG